jgi:putative oxidoreductase
MNFGKLVLRLVVGGLFVGHGLQKLRGSFGGPGLEGTEQMMVGTGMLPARRNALAVALTETVGGGMIAAGLLSPVAAAGLVATMVTAVRKVHWSNGVWNSGGGYEYNAVLAAAVVAIAEQPGRVSLDALFGKARWGSAAALFAVVSGVAGSLAVVELGRRGVAAAPAVDDTAE